MKKYLNEIFIAPVRRITCIKIQIYDLSILTSFSKPIYWDIFYYENDSKKVAISLRNKLKYSTHDASRVNENDLVVDTRYSIPFIEFFV